MLARRKGLILAVIVFILSSFVIFCNGNTIFTAEVTENQVSGSTVYRFPRPVSGEEYSLFRSSDSGYSLFAISTEGVVTTRKPLVYTVGKPNKYSLTVVRRAQGQTEGGIAWTLRVTVKDIDNYEPTFGADVYHGRVPEQSPENTVVDGLEKCFAEDRDASGIDAYNIVSGNERKYFKIETRAEGSRKFLVLKTTSVPIVRDPKSPYITLTVQAKQTGTTKIKIYIEDANDHTPKFTQNTYTAKIEEDASVQSSVNVRVNAKDEDVGTNGGLYYYLNPLNDYFMVDAVTGTVKVAQALDYSIASSYSLTVFAKDRGNPPKSSSAKVNIQIEEDVRSYPPANSPNPGQNTGPFFPEGSYTTSIREDFPIGGALLLIRAADNDPVGPNKKLTYALSGTGNTDFKINAGSGLVTLAKSVDYTSGGSNKYTLTVRATDGGGLSVESKLFIEIQDVDENGFTPKFNPQQKVVNIQEDLAIGKSVTSVSASDADGSGPDGTVMYSIIQGSGMGVFKVVSNTGDIVTDAPLDREKRSFYDLVIKAEDKATFPKSSNLYLMINILDKDDNNPYFSKPMYLAKVPENAAEDTFVTVVRAEDPDLNPSISYSIKSTQSAFKIESSTGVVRTMRSLSTARGEIEYELIIEAISSGNNAIGQLNVTVTSKADSPPTFKNVPYSITVPENQGVVTDLLCIAAVDTRELIVKYSLLSAGSEFAIDSNSGRFSALKSFDYDVEDKYKIQVEAVSGNSKRTVSTDIDISISDEKDPPSFSKSEYTISIDETTAKGTTINTGIKIIDQDTASDQFICSLENIQDLKILEYLSAVQQSDECKIVTKKVMDVSITPQFTFTMQAMDKNFHNMFTTAEVTLKVKDENNHAPVFSQTSYWVSVNSETSSGTRILELSTIDSDQGTFGEVTFQGITSSSSDFSRFSIDDNSGWISTTNKLQVNTKILFKVKAIDGGQKSATVDVFVSVYAKSDTPVKFDQERYSASLQEDKGKNTEVVQVTATKSGSSSGISYILVGGFMEDGQAMFTIDANSGKVFLNGQIDRERKSSYNLIIRAKHVGGSVELATQVKCVVSVDDINDESPQFAFDKDPKLFTVDNHSPADTTIGTIRAIDMDAGNNGRVTYSIDASSDGINNFKIDADKGTLMTKRKLTQEATYTNVILVATDGGSPQKTSRKKVTIEVLKALAPPTFSANSYNIPVQENARVGDTVTTVKAKYADPKAFLKYSFLSGNKDNSFCINKDGRITVARPLDREKVSSYTLKVQVARGNDKATTTVTVVVKDINDDSPVFEKTVYVFKVKENAGTSTSVGKVVAKDLDSGSSGTVSYKLLQAVDLLSESLFEVNKDSGVITTLKTLDYEDIKQHVLFIQAEDNGASKLSAITEVHIDVEDVNDNSPKFSAASYRAKVALDAVVGEHIVQVTATDLDSEKNAQPTYEIESGNDEKAFSVNKENGLITVAKSLTTVAADKFTLKIKAQDRGSSPKSADVKVEINVYLPDGPPKFVVSPIYAKATEGLEANKRVAVAKAATSEALKYEITSGNTNNMFKINPSTGEILTTRVLDYEEAAKYELVIIALDTRDRRAQVTVIIQVNNVNDNKPMFPGEVDGQIDRKVSGPFSKGVAVTRLGAIDKDVGDKIEYKLTPASVYNNFDMDSQGQLIAKNNLANIPSQYRFKITANDNGSPRQIHSANVRMVFVRYRPKQQPIRAMIPESSPVNSVVTQVPKYFPTGAFEIIFPEKSNFTIDNKGVVRLTYPLDFEKQAFHLITVREKQTVGKLTNDIDVEIYVIDLNDNKPFFTMTSTLGRVNKNARAGANVFQLSARDLDSGSNGLLGFQLLSPESPFTVNPFTKKIEVGRGLSDVSRYYPKALPFDYGRPRNNGTQATIDVETSQIPPLFSKTSYRFSVSERAHIGKSIGTVEAKSASGARLDYSIAEGDVNDRFSVKSDGRVVLNSLLINSPPQFNLKVRAQEQIPKPLHSFVQVIIDVVNANDFHPYFEKLFYKKDLLEDKSVGTVVQTVKAYDCDCPSSCQCERGLLKYKIEPRDYFAIDEDTGKVMISKKLDYEVSLVHLLKITAIDTGSVKYTAVCYLMVTVTNHNDNSPVFSNNAYEFRITEGALTNYDLAAVVAVDDDGDKVEYSMVTGAVDLKVNIDTGVLQLGTTLAAGNKNELSITIRAKDKDNNRNDAVVRFNIDHVNSKRPKFTKCAKASVNENLPKGQLITTVQATDADKGRYGEIEYSLVPVGGQNYFAINNRTGQLTTTASLDREKAKSYTVIIRAEDGGHGKLPEERLLSYCFLPVEVADVNDNSPKFITRTYLATIQYTELKGTPVLTVKASDDDSGDNAKVYYSLKSYSDKFEIVPETGVIKTRKDLSSGDVSKEFLTVVASNKPAARDSQSSERDRETIVEIFISDSAPPVCKQAKFTASVRESVNTGTAVLSVEATPGPGSPIIRYSPVKANVDVDQRFSVSPSGQITTASQLDYEALPENEKKFRLQVRAQQDGTNLFSTCNVEITLVDVNDDKPTFDLGSYDARVLENAAVGTTALNLIATDRDHGSAGEVFYSIKKDPNHHDWSNFTIDEATGIIKTKKVFDREKIDRYSFTVIATDKGTDPRSLSEEVTVRVLVVDQNDMAPKFNKTTYTVSVAENAPKGTRILSNLHAYDKDIGDNALLTYFISGGDMSGAFAVETITTGGKTYGILVVNGKLDYETRKSYQIRVSATDGRTSDTTTVDINILDVNDVPPVFQKPIYATSIAEGTKAGTFVMRLTATDVDSTVISYSLQSNAEGYFKVRTEKSGSVYAAIIETGNKELDREKAPIMMFEVYASDGKHIGKTEIQVNVTDINDSPPRFPDDQTYVGYIREGRPVGSSVMFVQAVDDDYPFAGGNAKIKYDLTNNADNKFKINADSGLITSLVEFKRDTDKPFYTVTVRATDQGSSKQLTATHDATIYIVDANTHNPIFTKTIYRGTVPENAPPGYRITKVSATDGDTGPNAELEYVVVSGNDPHVFYLNPYNGTVHVSGIIDYEVKKSYNLTVFVSDRGIPVLEGKKTAYVIISVTDTNDNAPVFNPKEYNRTVLENVPVGTVVVKATASDADSGKNSNFNFAITKGDNDDLFEIVQDPKNSNIGLVRTRLPLDRERIPISHLEITATDTGGLQGKADVWLTLVDVNDNGPWFVPPYFEGKIKENIDAAQFVTRLSAYDPDPKPNGGPFTYSIFNGTASNNFRLVEPATFKNATSNVNSYGRFNREEKITWKIGVRAVDSGSPKMPNFTYVYVDVQDENDNEPFDGSLKIIVNAYKGQFLCGSIGKPYYKDDDFDGDVNTYAIDSQSPGSYFTINEKSGIIDASPTIPMGNYELKVEITETNRGSNSKTVTSSISVLVRRIDPDAVKHGVSLQFTSLRKVEYFVGDYYESVVRLISDALGASAEVFSIQKAPNAVMAVNVHFAAKSGDSYMTRLDVINKLSGRKSDFEKLGLQVGAIGIDECSKEREKVGQCINVIEPTSKCSVASGDYGKVPAPDSSIAVVSMDVTLKDKYVSVITPQGNCSHSNPCLHGGTCHDSVPYGYMVCECLREYQGPQCQMTTRSFYGNSLIWLPKLSSYDIRDVSFEFMTEYPNGLLLYQGPLKKGGNNGAKDFLAVYLRSGYVVVMVSFGSEPITINITKGARLDDKEWHTVTIKRDLVHRKVIRVIVDKCEKATIVEENGRVFERRDTCEVTKKVLGRKTYLNGFGPLQIGGVDTDISWLGVPTKGFSGCIRKVIDHETMYDLEQPLKIVNAPKGCVPAAACPGCSNHGYCEPGLKKSICVCDVGYGGSNCNQRSPANYYKENSFSQYLLNTARAKRDVIPPPKSLTNEFYSTIVMKVKVDTDMKNCVIFLSSNSLGTEFSRVDIKDKVIRYIFRLGDRMKVLSIPQFNITDGKYHTIIIKREGNYASMQIDYTGFVAGNTGGVHKLLNMGGGSFFTGGLPNITEVRVIEAIVRSGGNTILRTADGRVLASGIGTDGSGGTSFGTGMTSTLITVLPSGKITTSSVVDSKGIFASGFGVRAVAINKEKDGKEFVEIINGRRVGRFGTAIGAQGGLIKNKYPTSGAHIGGIPMYDINGNEISFYGSGLKWSIQTGSASGGSPAPVSVIGDFGGCTSSNGYNGVNLDNDKSVDIRRQNVAPGCPCASGFCRNGGTCVNADPQYCICPPGWTGVRCETVITSPNPGQRPGTRWMNPGVIAIVLVVLLAVLAITLFVFLKKRAPPPVVPVMLEDGHVHDNIRPYHDEGAGEEDNFGYDITQLMKYTYIEGGSGGGGYGAGGKGGGGGYGGGGGGGGGYGNGGGGGYGNGNGIAEESIIAEDKPLLSSAGNNGGNGEQFKITTRRRVINPDSMDVGNFINQRVGEANGEYFIAHDSLHMFRYEGDDSDVDDLSELGDSDNEDDDDDQSFDFLQQWGRKFESLNTIYNLDS